MNFPKITYEGELTITENEKGIYKDLFIETKNNEKTHALDEIYHKSSFPLEIFNQDLFKIPENFYKIFRIKIRGNFFTHHIKVLINNSDLKFT